MSNQTCIFLQSSIFLPLLLVGELVDLNHMACENPPVNQFLLQLIDKEQRVLYLAVGEVVLRSIGLEYINHKGLLDFEQTSSCFFIKIICYQGELPKTRVVHKLQAP